MKMERSGQWRGSCPGYPDIFCFFSQELQTRLSDEIGKLRSFISSRGSGDRSAHNNERSSCELEVWGCPQAVLLPLSPPHAGGLLLAEVLAWGGWEGGAGWSSGASAGRRYASFPSAALPGRSHRFLPRPSWPFLPFPPPRLRWGPPAFPRRWLLSHLWFLSPLPGPGAAAGEGERAPVPKKRGAVPPGGAADDAKGWCFRGAIGKAAGEWREGSTRAAGQQGFGWV